MLGKNNKESYGFSEASIHVQHWLSILGCILITVFSSYTTAKEKDIVRIAMSTTPLSSPFIIAQEKGYFKEFGIDVDIKQVKGGNLAFKSLISGEVDIATSSEAVVMFNSFKRNDFSIFCTFVTSDNDVKILARSDSGINKISDLKGKKIGTIIGTSAHFFLNHTLLMNGVSEGDVYVSKLKPQESKKILEEKLLDAIVTWEPYAYLAHKELGDEVKIVEHDRVYVETFNAITMREYANKNEETLVKITQALMKAVQFIKNKPETTQKIVAKVLGKELHVIRSTWPDFSFSVGLNQWILTSLETEARWAIKHDFIKAKKIPNYMDFINTNPMNISAPNKITIY